MKKLPDKIYIHAVIQDGMRISGRIITSLTEALYIMCFVENPMGDWYPFLGLFLGAVGSALLILPTFPTVKSRIVNQDKINTLENGRQKLSKGNLVSRDDPSFRLIKKIIEERGDVELTAECYGFHRPVIEFSTTDQTYTDHSLIVYSSKQSDEKEEYPDVIQDLDSIFVIDAWIEDKIRELNIIPIQRIRGVGFFLVVLSVFVQAATSLS